MSVKTLILARQPNTVDDSRLDTKISIAQSLIDSGVFGDKYDYAVALQVLHWNAIDSRAGGSNTGGIAGSIQSLKEGDLSIGFGNTGSASSVDGNDLNQTAFGRELLALKQACIMTVRNRCV